MGVGPESLRRAAYVSSRGDFWGKFSGAPLPRDACCGVPTGVDEIELERYSEHAMLCFACRWSGPWSCLIRKPKAHDF